MKVLSPVDFTVTFVKKVKLVKLIQTCLFNRDHQVYRSNVCPKLKMRGNNSFNMSHVGFYTIISNILTVLITDV